MVMASITTLLYTWVQLDHRLSIEALKKIHLVMHAFNKSDTKLSITHRSFPLAIGFRCSQFITPACICTTATSIICGPLLKLYMYYEYRSVPTMHASTN